jgi:hypothetical protein
MRPPRAGVSDPDAAEQTADGPMPRRKGQDGGDRDPAQDSAKCAGSEHQRVERVGQPQDSRADWMPLGLIGVEQTRRSGPADRLGQLSTEVHGITDTGVHALAAER